MPQAVEGEPGFGREDHGIRLWPDMIGEVLLEAPHHGPCDGDGPLGPPSLGLLANVTLPCTSMA